MNDSTPDLRFVSRRVGILLLVTLAIFVLAVLQAGVVKDAFKSVATLRVILPDAGLGGLKANSPVEILGTTAGKVVRVVIDPNEKFHAEVEIDEAMIPFLRRDSTAIVRKQFGIAGDAYLEITRGQGEPLDWDFAVINAETTRGTSDTIDALIGEVRTRVFPILDDVQRITRSLAEIAARLQAPGGEVDRVLTDFAMVSDRLAKGEGTVGRLLADDRLARDLEQTVASINSQMAQIDKILKNVDAATGTVPEVVESADSTLQAVERTINQVGETMPELAKLVRNATTASAALPTFIAQTEQTLAELQTLLQQLQGHWLFGGGDGAPPREGLRPSPLEARP
jgi:phospholipid/cholesterol/gamma-HCH transport system substrate-binding protein